MRALTACCLALFALSSACSQKVLVKTSAPGARVTLGDVEVGEVSEEGEKVKVEAGLSPVPYVIEDARGRREGIIERTAVSWPWILGGVAGAACCVPSLVAGGACLANPALAAASLGCFLAASPAPCCAALAAPSWLTLPFAGAGALVGLSPLSLALLAEKLPDEVVLEDEAPGPATPTEEVPF